MSVCLLGGGGVSARVWGWECECVWGAACMFGGCVSE